MNGLQWPVAFDAAPAIFERLGWQLQSDEGGLTALPVSVPTVWIGELDGELSRVEFSVSDTLRGTRDENRPALQAAFVEAAQVVTRCMQSGPDGAPLDDEGVVWDLWGGQQLQLILGEDAINLDFWSEGLKEIVRLEYESEMGTPGASEEPNFEDHYFSREHFFSLGKETTSGSYFLSFPVSNGAVDYEEYFSLSDDEYRRFMADPSSALPLLEQCRRHQQDRRLMLLPGSNRGTPT